MCKKLKSCRSQPRTISLRPAPRTYIYLTVRQLKFRVDTNIVALRIMFCLYVSNPIHIRFHFLLNDWKIKVIEFHVYPHRQGSISHPIIVVRTTGCWEVWSCNYATQSLNINIRLKKSIHFGIKIFIKAYSSRPWIVDFFALVLALWIVAPRYIILLLF